MPDEKEDLFDSAGEAMGYISVDQARVLAIQHARANIDFYDPSIRHDSLVWEVESQLETDDYYEIRLSFRPARGFQGQAGIEQLTIDKTGKVEIRQMVRELVKEPVTRSTSEAVPSESTPLSASPLLWQVIAGVTLSGLAVALIFIGITSGFFGGGRESCEEPPCDFPGATEPPRDSILVTVASSSTKQDWLDQVVERFNALAIKTASGQTIRVAVDHVRSGSSMNDIRDGKLKPIAWSPGDQSWTTLMNEIWGQRENRPIISQECQPTVYAPIGFAMWRPMAEALGWPDTPIGWDTIVELAADPVQHE